MREWFASVHAQIDTFNSHSGCPFNHIKFYYVFLFSHFEWFYAFCVLGLHAYNYYFSFWISIFSVLIQIFPFFSNDLIWCDDDHHRLSHRQSEPVIPQLFLSSILSTIKINIASAEKWEQKKNRQNINLYCSSNQATKCTRLYNMLFQWMNHPCCQITSRNNNNPKMPFSEIENRTENCMLLKLDRNGEPFTFFPFPLHSSIALSLILSILSIIVVSWNRRIIIIYKISHSIPSYSSSPTIFANARSSFVRAPNFSNPNGILVQLVPMHICNYRCIIQFEILERISCNFHSKEMPNELPSNAMQSIAKTNTDYWLPSTILCTM